MKVRFILLFWLVGSLLTPFALSGITPAETTTSQTVDIFADGHVIGTPDGNN